MLGKINCQTLIVIEILKKANLVSLKFNFQNKKYIELTQMHTQDPRSEQHWSNCVAAEAGCVHIAENYKKKKNKQDSNFYKNCKQINHCKNKMIMTKLSNAEKGIDVFYLLCIVINE